MTSPNTHAPRWTSAFVEARPQIDTERTLKLNDGRHARDPLATQKLVQLSVVQTHLGAELHHGPTAQLDLHALRHQSRDTYYLGSAVHQRALGPLLAHSHEVPRFAVSERLATGHAGEPTTPPVELRVPVDIRASMRNGGMYEHQFESSSDVSTLGLDRSPLPNQGDRTGEEQRMVCCQAAPDGHYPAPGDDGRHHEAETLGFWDVGEDLGAEVEYRLALAHAMDEPVESLIELLALRDTLGAREGSL